MVLLVKSSEASARLLNLLLRRFKIEYTLNIHAMTMCAIPQNTANYEAFGDILGKGFHNTGFCRIDFFANISASRLPPSSTNTSLQTKRLRSGFKLVSPMR